MRLADLLDRADVPEDAKALIRAHMAHDDAFGVLEALLGALPFQVYVKDDESRFVAVSQDLCRALGVAEADLLGKTDADFLPPDVAAQHLAEDARVRESGEGYVDREYAFVDAAGERRWYLSSKLPIADRRQSRAAILGINREATGLKKTESALRESEARLRWLVEELPVALWELDLSRAKEVLERLPDQAREDPAAFAEAHPDVVHECAMTARVLAANPAALRLFGHASVEDADEAMATHWTPSTFRAFGEGLLKALRGERRSDLETTIRGHDDSVRHVLVRWVVRPTGAEALEHCVIAMVDVTDIRRAEIAREEAESRYTRMFAANPAPTLLYREDASGRLRLELANAAAERLPGLASGRVVGRTLEEVAPGLVGTRVPEMLLRVARTGEPWHVDQETYSGNGLSFDFRVDAYQAAPGAVCVTLTDMTEQVRASETLRQREQQLAESQRIAHLGSFEWDPETGTVLCSEELCRIHGWPGADRTVTISDLADAIHPEDAARLRAGAERILESTEPLEGEYRILGPDGAVRFVHSRAQAVTAPGTGRRIVRGTVQDVTERHEAELARQRLEAGLHRTQRLESLGVLAGGIAHDFNNVLGAILGYTELAMADMPPASPSRASLENVLAAADRAKDLIQQILAFSRRTERETKPVLLQPLLTEALRFLRSSLPTTIEIRQDLDPACPPVQADATQIHQVVMNLCTNAHHAMREAGGVLEVTLAARDVDEALAEQLGGVAPGPCVCLTVADTGHGMAPETRQRIFEPFFTTKGAGEGSGMGLATAHGIVTGHGGAIDVRSEVGVGSVFRVFLPALQADANADESVGLRTPSGTERVLIVDDESAVAEMARQMLASVGYEVTALTDPQLALEAVEAAPGAYDLLITDQTMPKLTGLQLAAKVAQVRSDLAVIVTTGYSRDLDGDAPNVSEILTKPYGLHALASAARRALDALPSSAPLQD